MHGVAADATDEAALRRAIDEIVDRFGRPELLVYNAALIRRDEFGELTAPQQLAAWAVNVVGAITAIAHLAPGWRGEDRGTIVITGGMPSPCPLASLSLGKAGVRTHDTLLARTYGEAGLHVASVTCRARSRPVHAFDPDDIAEHHCQLHSHPPGAWEHEVIHGPVPPPTESASHSAGATPPTPVLPCRPGGGGHRITALNCG